MGQIYSYRKGGKEGVNKIFYIDKGQGEVILALHGFPTSSWDWSWIFQDLVKNYRIIAPDYLGFGFSDKPRSHKYSIIEQVDLVIKLLRTLDIQNIHILAHDYGDTVAQELLARLQEEELPIRIRSVFLSNGGIFPDKIQFRLIQKLLLSPIGWIVSRLIFESRFHKSFSAIFEIKPTDKELKEFWKIITTNNGHRIGHKIIEYINERFDNQDRWVNALVECDLPICFLVGLKDPVSGSLMGKQFKNLVSDNVIKLEGIGHYPQVEAPKIFLSHYLDFLNTITDTS